MLLVSVRAVGMTTAGVACARDVGWEQALAKVRAELAKSRGSPGKVAVSSVYLYEAIHLEDVPLVHSDWIAPWPPGGNPMARLNAARPAKLILTQFDFYRHYQWPLQQWLASGAVRSVHIENTARTLVPDASPRWQRVLQHISWAPVIITVE